jgi:hypothetical protein
LNIEDNINGSRIFKNEEHVVKQGKKNKTNIDEIKITPMKIIAVSKLAILSQNRCCGFTVIS